MIGPIAQARRWPVAIAVIVIALVHISRTSVDVQAADGDLDETFGSGGIVTTQFGFDWHEATSVALQRDGKAVVAGIVGSDFDDIDLAVARYNTDGSLDPTFGAGGQVITEFSFVHDYARAVAVQADGRIVVAGTVNFDFGSDFLSGDFGLVRYNSDGSLDTSFDGDGMVATTIIESPDPRGQSPDFVKSLALQADGKIVVLGEVRDGRGGPRDFALVRYNSDGSLDATFGQG